MFAADETCNVVSGLLVNISESVFIYLFIYLVG
jgi:hypothetical protein